MYFGELLKIIFEKKDDYDSAVKEWEAACPMPNTKTLEEKVRTKLEKYFARKKKLNQHQKISFTQIHMDMVRESVDFDDIFQYQPGKRSRLSTIMIHESWTRVDHGQNDLGVSILER